MPIVSVKSVADIGFGEEINQPSASEVHNTDVCLSHTSVSYCCVL